MATVCGILGNVSKFVMDVLNHTTYYHRDKLLKALATREEGQVCVVVTALLCACQAFRVAYTAGFVVSAWGHQGVLTVCNHVSAVDDPGAVAVLLPQYWLWQPTVRFVCVHGSYFARCG